MKEHFNVSEIRKLGMSYFENYTLTCVDTGCTTSNLEIGDLIELIVVNHEVRFKWESIPLSAKKAGWGLTYSVIIKVTKSKRNVASIYKQGF